MAEAWTHLARLAGLDGRPVEAEQWYRKALGFFESENDQFGKAMMLGRLADLLRNDPQRLAEDET